MESMTKVDELAPDILRGAGDIAKFLFGDRGSKRQVYHLAQTQCLPTFRLGSTLCARRSTLLKWIADQEAVAADKGLSSGD